MNTTFEYKGREVEICASHRFTDRFQFFIDSRGGQDTCGVYAGYKTAGDAKKASKRTIDAEDFGELSRAAFGPSSSPGAGK